MNSIHEASFSQTVEGAALIAFHVLNPFMRTYRACWGATLDDLLRKLPGDELIPRARWESTHAITINAAPSEVWGWLVQIGVGRGGLYSYEGLENLVGCHIHNVDEIIPEYQHLKAGDEIRLHPKVPAMHVAVVEPEHYILVHNDTHKAGVRSYIHTSWLWYLDTINETTTRLISRSRNDYSPELANKLWMGPLLVEPISFVMERKMMLGIKQRSELHWTFQLSWAF